MLITPKEVNLSQTLSSLVEASEDRRFRIEVHLFGLDKAFSRIGVGANNKNHTNSKYNGKEGIQLNRIDKNNEGVG